MVIQGHGEYFHAALQHLFVEHKWKQVALAEAAGINQGTVSELLNAKSTGTWELQEKIAKAFGLELVDMVALGRNILAKQKIELPMFDGEPLSEAEIEALSAVLQAMRGGGGRGGKPKPLPLKSSGGGLRSKRAS